MVDLVNPPSFIHLGCFFRKIEIFFEAFGNPSHILESILELKNFFLPQKMKPGSWFTYIPSQISSPWLMVHDSGQNSF